MKPSAFEVGGFCGFMWSLVAPALGAVMNSDGSLLLGVNVPLLCSRLFSSTVLPPFIPLPVYPGMALSAFQVLGPCDCGELLRTDGLAGFVRVWF